MERNQIDSQIVSMQRASIQGLWSRSHLTSKETEVVTSGASQTMTILFFREQGVCSLVI